MKNVYYNPFDNTAKYYVKGIYGMKEEIKKGDLRFHIHNIKVKKQLTDIVNYCQKCT